MKVSIIVPIYKVEKYLERCLDSIVNQTFSDYEIICVNDCSPDNSQKIVDRYVEKYPQLIKSVQNEENLGLGKTREHGLSVSQGDYVMFIDSDDYIKNDYIETYYNTMKSDNVDIVIGGYIRDVEGKYTVHKVPDSVWSIVTYTIACAKMFRKAFLLDNNIKFPTIRCGEDIYFSMELLYYGASYKVMDYAGYYYYFNKDSITGSLNYDKKHEAFVVQIFDEFLENYDLNLVSKDVNEIIEYNYITNMINALITYGHGCGIKKMREKYDYWISDMMKRFPDYKKNSYLGITKTKGQMLKVRMAVGVVMDLHRIHLDRYGLYIISLI